MAPQKGHIPWNKGVKTGIKPWLGKKRPDLKNSNAGKTMFKKGLKPWNTGKKMPVETVEKMRKAKLGSIPWNKGKKVPELSEQRMGSGNPMYGKLAWNSGKTSETDNRILAKEDNPNWQGGITAKNWSFRHTWQYKQWRREVLERDNYSCIQCGSIDRLQVDHIKAFSIYKDKRLDPNNGRVLCFRCHIKTPTWGGRLQGKGVVPYGAIR